MQTFVSKQQETFLNIQGDAQLIQACKDWYASLFSDHVIIYRIMDLITYKLIFP